ncbi:RNA-dependent DNA polymerase [Vibrio parahaemolyticus]|uniref:retron St85 family RNA-directed DNA polymerase n=1 Tax=Vibrio parahaemolyticus TaxID=670 RepID=UPI00111FC65A|nr:retron St85 family RNA-directed DNA polymerase [Vibrio parahaemolyticus]TOH59278.1 RNA-dependent DNA polymerase [Vibrio parahaemolyticus]
MLQRLYSKLQKKLEIPRYKIESFSSSAPNRYKVYTIPKRTSGRRVIAHPSRELKKYQRALVSILTPLLSVHKCSFAYKKGVSIKENALEHAKNSYLLKMDFNDFFNSIDPELFFLMNKSNGVEFSDSEKKLIQNLVFWNKTKSYEQKLVLSVGAPSSPFISNFVMFKFDELIEKFSKKNNITYTRYADDITFSTNKRNALFLIPEEVNNILREHYGYRITVNSTKTVFSSKAHNRHITGITINNEGQLSIGRDRKRMISSLIHKYSIKVLDISDFQYLQGLLSFASHVEPRFLDSMTRKYGHETITNIVKGDFYDS